MLHKGTADGPRHQPFIDHSAVFSLLTSVARSVDFTCTIPVLLIHHSINKG